MSASIALEGVRFAHGAAGGARKGGFELRVDALSVAAGERVACIGPSGTGKTTLVNLIAGILLPTEGEVRFDGISLGRIGEEERRALRVRRIGMVFQEFALLEYASALDNVLLPYLLSPHLAHTPEVETRARALAARLGLAELLGRKPRELSQGERQRVALCRALVTEPELLLCDEATGNLDPEAAARAVDLLLEEAAASGATVFLVTHDHGLLSRFERVVDMRALIAPARPHGVEP